MAHSFDINTLKVINEVTEIRIISDGLSIFPFKQNGFLWIPQQLWEPKSKKRGVWTICLHPNTMNQINFVDLESFIKEHQKNFEFRLEDVINKYNKRKRSIVDIFYFHWFLNIKKIKDLIKLLLRFINLSIRSSNN